MRREVRRLIVYSMMRLMITIRDRRGASQQAFRRLMTGIFVWPLNVLLTIVAFGLLHNMIWSGAPAPVEQVASVYIPPPPTKAPANAIIEWMVNQIDPMMIALFVIVLGVMLIAGHHTWTRLTAMIIAVIVISHFQTIASLFLTPEQIAHEQTVSPKQAESGGGLMWLGAVGAATRR